MISYEWTCLRPAPFFWPDLQNLACSWSDCELLRLHRHRNYRSAWIKLKGTVYTAQISWWQLVPLVCSFVIQEWHAWFTLHSSHLFLWTLRQCRSRFPTEGINVVSYRWRHCRSFPGEWHWHCWKSWQHSAMFGAVNSGSHYSHLMCDAQCAAMSTFISFILICLYIFYVTSNISKCTWSSWSGILWGGPPGPTHFSLRLQRSPK